MRIRSVKPEFWEDEDVAGLPVQTRLTFIGLWNLADDSGYFRSRLIAIAAALYRFEPTGRRNRHVSEAMSRLEAHDMVEMLSCGVHGRVVNLPKHQRLAGEGRQVHTFRREHDEECVETSASQASPRKPAHPRGSPRKARTSPPSRAPAGREGEVSPTEMVGGGVEGEGARIKMRGTNGSRSVDQAAIDESIALAKDESKSEGVRRAARRAVERHAPERLGEIPAGAA